jgi:hypothetical protein
MYKFLRTKHQHASIARFVSKIKDFPNSVLNVIPNGLQVLRNVINLCVVIHLLVKNRIKAQLIKFMERKKYQI